MLAIILSFEGLFGNFFQEIFAHANSFFDIIQRLLMEIAGFYRLNLMSLVLDKIITILVSMLFLGLILGLFTIYGEKFSIDAGVTVRRIDGKVSVIKVSGDGRHSAYIKKNTKLTV